LGKLTDSVFVIWSCVLNFARVHHTGTDTAASAVPLFCPLQERESISDLAVKFCEKEWDFLEPLLSTGAVLFIL
jgi:hypothetical protein